MTRTILVAALLCACGSKPPAPQPVAEPEAPVDTTPTLDRLPAITADGANVVVAAGLTLLVMDRADAVAHEHAFANADEANAQLRTVHAERELHPLETVAPGGSFDVRFNEGRVIVMSGGSPVHDKTYRAWTRPPEACSGAASVDATWADAGRKVALLRLRFEPAETCARYHVVAW
jgi:hypothetical protein